MDTKAASPEYPLRVREALPREPIFRKILPFISRRFWTLLIAWLAAGVMIDILLHMPKTGFAASTTLLMVPPDSTSATSPEPPSVEEAAIWRETRPLQSKALIGAAVDRLNLAQDSAWNYGSASLPPALDWATAPLSALGVPLKPNTPLRARAAIIERLQSKVRVTRAQSSLVVDLTVTSPVPADSVVIANTLADLYVEDRLEKQFQQSASGAPQAFGARVVDRAIEAEKAPSPFGNLEAWSALFGLITSVGIALGIDYLDRGVGGASRAMKKTGRPVIGSLPLLRKHELAEASRRNVADAVIANPMSAFAEALRNLRTSLLYASEDSAQPKLICVLAARHGEGKTTTALALARIAALAGQRTLIVDCELQRHSLGRMLNLSVPNGIVEAVSGGADWRDSVVRDAPSGADMLLVSQAYYRPRDFFSALAVEKLFAEFRAAYDLVILSAPAAFSGADARTISRLSDRTIVVAHWTRTPATMLRALIQNLEATGSDVAGLVLNFVDPRARGRLTETDTAYQAKFATRYYKS
jgi:Mrp family chromosome partitioning ATPase